MPRAASADYILLDQAIVEAWISPGEVLHFGAAGMAIGKRLRPAFMSPNAAALRQKVPQNGAAALIFACIFTRENVFFSPVKWCRCADFCLHLYPGKCIL